MATNDTEAAGKITAALLVQLLNKLCAIGILNESDVNEMTAEATNVLKEPTTDDAFKGLAERLQKQIDEG